MGYFCYPLNDSNEELIESCLGNINLFINIEENKNNSYNYLLEMAIHDLKKFKERLNELEVSKDEAWYIFKRN